jgi:hypothetical protein
MMLVFFKWIYKRLSRERYGVAKCCSEFKSNHGDNENALAKFATYVVGICCILKNLIVFLQQQLDEAVTALKSIPVVLFVASFGDDAPAAATRC